MSEKFILDGHTPVHVDDVLEWCRWFEAADESRRVGSTHIGGVHVSTVFLGLDHSFGKGPPLLFETMVFGGPQQDQEQRRYSTWDEAEKGHVEVVALIQNEVGTWCSET